MKKMAVIFCIAILILFILITATFAQVDTASVRQVRFFKTEELEIPNPASLSFSHGANTFQVLTEAESTRASVAEIFLLSPTECVIGSLRIADAIKVPVHMAFDNDNNRLLIFKSNSKPMIELKIGSDGNLDPNTLTQHNVQHFGVKNPQGMAVDPDNGHVLFLDSIGPRLVRIEPDSYGGFENAMISQVDLQSSGLTEPCGIALDPNTGHLHILGPLKEKLYELTQGGQIVAIRDLSELDLSDLRGMVFAPSGDLTDNPTEVSLYIADTGPNALQDHKMSFFKGGRIIELSIIQLADFKSIADKPMLLEEGTIQGALVQTIDVSQFSPPSPDASGITYINTMDTLLFSDSEVNEMHIFTGENLFEMSLSGNLIDTFTTISYSPEPTGVAYNLSNEHVFISDDNLREVFELESGPDGYYGTSDDIITSFITTDFNSDDPEGVAFDSMQGILYIADGKNNEVYRVSPGANGIFDGSLPAGDDEVNSFDTEILGVTDPEGIAFDTDNGLLYIVGEPSDLLAHVTTNGTLVRMIDISAANAIKPAGLAYAPSSVDPLKMNIYITERGVDNLADPYENDGKVYEMSFPSFPGNLPPTVDAGPDNLIILPEDSVLLDGNATDDGNPSPPGALTLSWSQISGPGTVFFENDSAENTLAIFPEAGEYILRLTASDSDITSTDEMIVTLIDPTVGSIDIRVAAVSDDAEESSSGSMYLNSSDLELVFNHSDQTIGMRFNGVEVPQGAFVTNAFIQFKVDEVNEEVTHLIIEGQASDNASTFTANDGNVSSRPRTIAGVSWAPEPWRTIGQAGLDQQTPDIASIVQEIVDQPGWRSGNSLVIIITGSGERTAESYDGDQNGAPQLYVEFTTNGLNYTPVAANDTTNTPENTPVIVNVLDNDYLGDEPTSITAVTQAGNLPLRFSDCT